MHHIKRQLNNIHFMKNLIRDIRISTSLKFPIVNIDSIKKLGTSYGGWIVPTDMINKDAICYCAGAGEDISFDCILAEQYDC